MTLYTSHTFDTPLPHSAHTQAFVLSAMKLHCYMRTLRQQGCGRGPASDPRALLVAMQSAVSYMHTLITARTSAAASRFNFPCWCGGGVDGVKSVLKGWKVWGV